MTHGLFALTQVTTHANGWGAQELPVQSFI